MQQIFIQEFEFANDYFEPIKQIVRDNNPFVSTAYLSDIYNLEEYMLSDDDTKLKVLIDNNIFTRLVYLSKGGEVKGTVEEIKTYKLCCAVMCFFILGGFEIEPNMALYERASKNTHLNAIEDVFNFRVADHIHPMAYANLALGVEQRFSNEEIERAKNFITKGHLETEEYNFTKELDDWKIVYLHLLKIYEVHKTGLNDTDKIKLFLEWVTNDCSSTAVSTLFALLFFSPKNSSLGTMIKSINSSNETKIIRGLKNAAWDLAYTIRLRKLSKNQPENVIWFFCTHDKVLQKIVRNLYLKNGQEIQEGLNILIIEFWGNKKGNYVLSYYKTMASSILQNSEKRILHNKNIKLKIDEMIEKLEINLLSTQPVISHSIYN